MENYINHFLSGYILTYIFLIFFLKSMITGLRIKKSPFIFPKSDKLEGLTGNYFKLYIIALTLLAIAISIFPEFYLMISKNNNEILEAIGSTTLIVSLVWTLISQWHMKDSWRIGVNPEEKTKLVTDGVFSISRNPVFLGMILTILGIFICLPHWLTLSFLIVGYMLIQIQIRIEENYLENLHGKKFELYKTKVKRLI